MKILELHFKTYFDKTYGNSYFAGRIFIDNKESILIPFQYGYGTCYLQEAKAVLTELNYISCNCGENIKEYCKRNNINYIEKLMTNCKKKELKNI